MTAQPPLPQPVRFTRRRPPEPEPVELTVDGTAITVPAGSTLLEACRAAGVDVPTLCWLETLTPVNVCRVCVVEVQGSRTLVPACSRPAEDGMVVATASDRVLTSRRMVLELLASAVELDRAGPELLDLLESSGADPARYGPDRATVQQPVKREDDLFARDYARCVLCYKCVEACGDDAQHTFAIAVAGRGFGARIATEYEVPLPESACVYCGNCIAVCPTGALIPTAELDLRESGRWAPERQTVTRTVCPYCGVGCNLELHEQDGRIFRVTSPLDHEVSYGNLCIKGRFGYRFAEHDPGADADTAASGPGAGR